MYPEFSVPGFARQAQIERPAEAGLTEVNKIFIWSHPPESNRRPTDYESDGAISTLYRGMLQSP
jgi:hypothetical protein